MQMGATAAESVSIEGADVVLRAEGRAEVYDLAYVRLIVPYLTGERSVAPMRLVHFRPGVKPWICLSVIDDDGYEPDLSGVAIYSGLGSHREMGLHLSRAEAWRLAEVLQGSSCAQDTGELDGELGEEEGEQEGEQEGEEDRAA
ncbi:hypothetical protein MO973_37890 [Paenibacillus sp. TRM 82003]|uniref:hypothetical protein n=1 Tax=Kineococcus sp. TRM81007 TaxID=2925831 RepID=UPI001F5627EA|nr:hypothetical protein [Kineococcus sp. TRM81007]MCI2237962.1 hypothetical protein [Kineococcus sp. TRM81007]MCI3925977.1 hypothetical protein [Paenibacillus sp. TRM 82003]